MAEEVLLHGHWYSIEPLYLFFVIANTLHSPIFQQFVYERLSEEYNVPYSYKAKSSCGSSSVYNASTEHLRKRVQSDASYFEIGMNLCNNLPAVIVCLYVGSLSDRFGRKPLFLLAVGGSLAQASFILVTMYFKLPLWVMFIGAFIFGVSGYLPSVVAATLSYIADVSEKGSRAVRIGYFEATYFVGATVSIFVSGHLIRALGFRNAYWIVVAFLVAAFLYTLVVLPESLPPALRRESKLAAQQRGCLFPFARIYRVLSKVRPGRWKLQCLVPATVSIYTLQFGILSVLFLFILNTPLCLDSVDVGYVVGTRYLVTGIGTGLGLKILCRFIPDYVLMVLGLISHVAGFAVLAFSDQKWLVYVAFCVSVFAGFSNPLFRSVLSKTVNEDEQGAIFAFSTSAETLFSFIGTFAFNSFYAFTNSKLNFPGAVFLLDCGLASIPFVCSIVYWIRSRYHVEREKLVSVAKEDQIGSHANKTEQKVPSYGSNGCSSPLMKKLID